MKHLAILALLVFLAKTKADGLEKRLGGASFNANPGGGGVSFNLNPGGLQSSLPNILNTLTSGLFSQLSGGQGMSWIGNLISELSSGIIPPMCGAQNYETGIPLGLNFNGNINGNGGFLGGLFNTLWNGLNEVASNIPQTLLPSINPGNIVTQGMNMLNQVTSGIFQPLSGALGVSTGQTIGGVTAIGGTNSGSLGGLLGSTGNKCLKKK